MIVPFPNKKYQVIYADPPWRYNFSKTKNREIENHYPTMDIDTICKLSVPYADNCILFLWATAPKLVEALKVIKAWGFEYKTHAIWDKGIIGMGFWFRGQHELLIVATRGKVSPPPQTLRISSIYSKKRTKHRWYPDKSKVELFARQKVDGWDAWGNEIENDIII
jgi:N6-adenosine-specific RNA methylase IME4